MADITKEMELADSTPQEAAENINNAKAVDVSPENYKEMKVEFEPEVKKLKLPTEATPGVARYIAQSPETAALAAPDVEKLSQAENRVKVAADKMRGRDVEKLYNDLLFKKTNNADDFTQDDGDLLFQYEEEVKQTKKYQAEQKPGKHEEIIASTAEATKTRSTLEDFYNATLGGFASANKTLAEIPRLVYDIGAIPQNLVNLALGRPQTKAPEWLAENPMVKYYSDAADQFNEKVPDLNKSIAKSVTEGNFTEAGKIAALQITSNAPQQLALIISSLGGAKWGGLAAAGVSAAASANTENQTQGATPLQSIPNALAKGSFEVAFEKIGTMGILKNWESALTKSYGKDSAIKIMQNTVKAILYSAGAEGKEEALTSVAGDVTDYVSGINPQAFEGTDWLFRAIDSGIVGAGSGGGMTAPAAIAKAASNVRKSDIISKNQASPTDKAIRTLRFDEAITEAVDLTKNSEMQNLAPDQAAEVRKNILDEAGIKKVFIDQEDLQNFANNDKKAAAVEKIMTGQSEPVANAPVQIDAHKFAELVTEFPDASEIGKMQPEDPNVIQAKDYLGKKAEIEANKIALFDKLSVDELTEEKQREVNETLRSTDVSGMSHDVFNEADYLNQPTFTEAIASVVGDAEITRFNEAQNKVRQRIVDNINETAKYEMDEVRDILVEEATAAQIETETERLQNDPNLAIVDKFVAPPDVFPNNPSERYKHTGDMMAAHAKEGYSPYAIDPRTLPEDLAKKYLADPQLKKHKVFVKGGININDAVRLLGMNNPKNLLRVLSKTPSRQELIERNVQLREKEISDLANSSVELNQTAIAKAYSANTANHLAEMNFLKNKEWSTTRGGIRRIALPLPKIEQISYKAKKAVSASRVGDLNVNQFKVGERKSQRIAVDAILKNEVERAFVNKEAAALNSELAKETHIAIGKINRILKFAKRFNKADVQQELKAAGKMYTDAVNEILDVFNLDPSKKKQSEQGAYQKYVEKMIDQGQGDFQLPERYSDLRDSVNDMTVEQLLAVGDRLKNVLHTARYKNRLFKKIENIKSLQTIQALNARALTEAQKVADFDPARNEVVQDEAITKVERAGAYLSDLRNSLERPQHIITKLDNGNVTGFFNDLLYRPIADADHENKRYISKIHKQLEKLIENFGKKEFEQLASDFVYVPEFVGIPSFRDGKVSKATLLAMELNFGNEGNIEVLERFGVDRENLRMILDRVLPERYTTFAQNVWNMFESFKEQIAELQMRTEGTEVQWVQARPFTARGKAYPGGYYPIAYVIDDSKIAAEKLQGAGVLSRLEKFKQNYYGKAMTDQGHLEARTSSSQLADLSLGRIGFAFAQVVHDITMRETIADTAKILSDKQFRETIISVIGKEGYRNIADMVVDVAESVENKAFDRNTDGILKFLNYLGGGFQTVAIAGKLTSIAIQPASIGFAINRMGRVSGTKYFLKALTRIASKPQLIKEFFDFAQEIHPPIRTFNEQQEGNSAIAINQLMPTKQTKYVSVITNARDTVVEQCFEILGRVDQLNKTIVVLAAYSQAMEGEAKGVKAGNHTEAAKYASNMAELTQTHSDLRNLAPAQKNKWIKWMLMFFNDINNAYNNTIAEARVAKAKWKEFNDAKAHEDYKKASKAAAEGVFGIMGFMFMLTMIKSYENMIRGNPMPWGGDDDERTSEEFLADVAKYFLTSPADMVVGTLPLVRDVNFAMGKYWEKKKTVDMPLDSTLGDFATSLVAIEKYLDFADEDVSLSKNEKKAIVKSVGVLTKTPTAALYQYINAGIEKYEDASEPGGTLASLSKSIDKFLKNNNGNEKVPDEMFEELKEIKNEIDPAEVSNIPEDRTLDIIKQIESKGDPFAFNPNSSAAGLYQFTEETWNDISKQAPELGLTENGRVDSNGVQQEQAMLWLSSQNIKSLKRAEITPDVDNIFAAHFLGAPTAIKVLKASGDMKLKTLVGAEVMKANGFNNSMKVKDFKDWLSQKTLQAESEIDAKVASN